MREQDRGKIKTPFMLAFSVGAVLFRLMPAADLQRAIRQIRIM